jgi:hypothetical protein
MVLAVHHCADNNQTFLPPGIGDYPEMSDPCRLEFIDGEILAENTGFRGNNVGRLRSGPE